ncbi:MAG TPA: DUF6456 domain-containing protein [Inquilinus sp.]|nr:DUF6456 domain-containing protein [Inquilinus sp.]
MAKDRTRQKPSAAAMRETPERAQHAAGIVDRPIGTVLGTPVGRLVQAPIDRMIARGSISRRMHSAGQTLRGQFEIGVLGAQNRDGELPPGIRGTAMTRTPGEVQLDTLAAYKTALRCLGAHVGAVVVAVCCYEHGVAVVAKQQGRHPDKVMGVLEDGLKTLADHYRLTGTDDLARVGA